MRHFFDVVEDLRETALLHCALPGRCPVSVRHKVGHDPQHKVGIDYDEPLFDVAHHTPPNTSSSACDSGKYVSTAFWVRMMMKSVIASSFSRSPSFAPSEPSRSNRWLRSGKQKWRETRLPFSSGCLLLAEQPCDGRVPFLPAACTSSSLAERPRLSTLRVASPFPEPCSNSGA
eukprot:GHVR01064990.1.p1 GENE.GHVR01064990.1~~GHVR01064990.1.p1  ORF type:complete len:174 (+),score=7.35 GHVR01064990.1:160-681(+)